MHALCKRVHVVSQSFRAIGMIGARSLPDDVRKLYSVLGKQSSPLPTDACIHGRGRPIAAGCLHANRPAIHQV